MPGHRIRLQLPMLMLHHCGGTVVEDIDNYSRVHELMKMLTAKDKRVNDDAEAFGQQYDKYTDLDALNLSSCV